MENLISFMTANFIARQNDYQLSGPIPGSWGEGNTAANEWFKPIETYRVRFAEMLDEVVAMGFTAIDLWTAHLNPIWMTPDHVEIAKAELKRRELTVTSLAGGLGGDRLTFERTCDLAAAMGDAILGGPTPLLATDRDWIVQQLRDRGLRLGYENHPEKSSDQVIAAIGPDAYDVIGVAADTGWFGTQGFDAARALRDLAPYLMHIHLKDVRAAGAHETCRFGEGIVPLEQCLSVLSDVGYSGPLSIEHEPHDYDPTDDVIASRNLTVKWMGKLS